MKADDESITQAIYQRALAAETEAERAELLREIAVLNPEKRAAWAALLADVEALRRDVADVPVPADLAARLMAVPGPAAPVQRGFSWRKASWVHVAVAVAAILLIAIYLEWPQREAARRAPIPLAALDTNVVGHVASLALQHYTASLPPTTGPASLEADQALAKLQAASLPFKPIVLMPHEAMSLQDAGVTMLGETPAAFVRWQSGKAIYTIYQFDRQAFGLPKAFTPTAAAQHPPGVQVEIWPGTDGRCGWVMVAEGSTRSNPFLTY